jgi:hypothetical protein
MVLGPEFLCRKVELKPDFAAHQPFENRFEARHYLALTIRHYQGQQQPIPCYLLPLKPGKQFS